MTTALTPDVDAVDQVVADGAEVWYDFAFLCRLVSARPAKPRPFADRLLTSAAATEAVVGWLLRHQLYALDVTHVDDLKCHLLLRCYSFYYNPSHSGFIALSYYWLDYGGCPNADSVVQEPVKAMQSCVGWAWLCISLTSFGTTWARTCQQSSDNCCNWTDSRLTTTTPTLFYPGFTHLKCFLIVRLLFLNFVSFFGLKMFLALGQG